MQCFQDALDLNTNTENNTALLKRIVNLDVILMIEYTNISRSHAKRIEWPDEDSM